MLALLLTISRARISFGYSLNFARDFVCTVNFPWKSHSRNVTLPAVISSKALACTDNYLMERETRSLNHHQDYNHDYSNHKKVYITSNDYKRAVSAKQEIHHLASQRSSARIYKHPTEKENDTDMRRRDSNSRNVSSQQPFSNQPYTHPARQQMIETSVGRMSSDRNPLDSVGPSPPLNPHNTSPAMSQQTWRLRIPLPPQEEVKRGTRDSSNHYGQDSFSGSRNSMHQRRDYHRRSFNSSEDFRRSLSPGSSSHVPYDRSRNGSFSNQTAYFSELNNQQKDFDLNRMLRPEHPSFNQRSLNSRPSPSFSEGIPRHSTSISAVPARLTSEEQALGRKRSYDQYPPSLASPRMGSVNQKLRGARSMSNISYSSSRLNNSGGSRRTDYKPYPDTIFSESYIQKKYDPDNQYAGNPEVEKWIKNPKSLLANYVSRLSGKVPEYKFETFGPLHNVLVRCSVVANETLNIVGIGDSKSKKEAEKLAALDACYQLEIAKWFLPQRSSVAGKKIIDPPRGDPNSRKHVFDYCARFQFVPEFVYTSEGPDDSKIWYCTVEYPAQGIYAHGQGRNKKDAEQDAAADFKLRVEELAPDLGASFSTDLSASGSRSLTFSTAKSFIDFYCRLYNFGRATVEYDAKGPTHDTMWEATLIVKDAVIGIGRRSAKKDALEAAYLDAAIELRKDTPELWDKFLKAEKDGTAGGAAIVSLGMGVEAERMIERLLKSMRNTELYLTEQGDSSLDHRSAPRNGPSSSTSSTSSYNFTPLSEQYLRTKSLRMYETHQLNLHKPAFAKFREQKSQLPITQFTQQILHQIESSPVSVLVGSTGSGKTTQVPQIILEDAIAQKRGAYTNIIVTQPRRIAAITVAQRVAQERGERLGESVGYQVRFENVFPKNGGSILYCTTGVFLRRLQGALETATGTRDGHVHKGPGNVQSSQRDPLEGVTHIVVDEVHERDINTDFLLVILKRLLEERRRTGKQLIRIILMSATIDSSLFTSYFAGEKLGVPGKACSVLEVPGKIFPVKQFYIEDFSNDLLKMYNHREISPWLEHPDTVRYLERERRVSMSASQGRREIINWSSETDTEKEDAEVPFQLMALTIAHILKTTHEGSILVFLPGWEEIMTLNRLLLESQTPPLGIIFKDSARFRIYMLHSSLPNVSQQEVFEPLPSSNMRKIILATNIAETSITIPDVVFVVDSAKVKENRYDQSKRMTNLITTWISRSNIRQRMGRAGRICEGQYYPMLSRAREENLLEPFSTPEMLRSDLQEICLHIKALELPTSIKDTLEEAIQPPDHAAVDAALDSLKALEALNEDETLTPLGSILGQLPVEPALGKMVLLGAVFGALDPILTIAAGMASKDPFTAPPTLKKEADEKKMEFALRVASFSGVGPSDHLAVLGAYNMWWEMQSAGQYRSANAFLTENYLSKMTMTTIQSVKAQLLSLLEKSGVVPASSTSAHNRDGIYDRDRDTRRIMGPPEYNANANSIPLLAALVCAGVHPNIAVKKDKKTYRTHHDNIVFMHPSSVNYRHRHSAKLLNTDDEEGSSAPPGTIYAYSNKIKNSSQQIFLRNTTKVEPLAIILFSSKMRYQPGEPLSMNEWLRITGSAGLLDMADELRWVLDRALETLFARLGENHKNQRSGRYILDEEDRASFDLIDGIVRLLKVVSEEPNPRSSWSSRSSDRYRPPSTYSSRPSSRSDSRPHSRQEEYASFNSSASYGRGPLASSSGSARGPLGSSMESSRGRDEELRDRSIVDEYDPRRITSYDVSMDHEEYPGRERDREFVMDRRDKELPSWW